MSDAPRLDQLNIVVGDMAASLEFYRLLGVQIPDTAVWSTYSGAHHASAEGLGGLDFALDSESLAQAYDASWRGAPIGVGRVMIGFRMATREAVDARYDVLTAAGHVGLQPPYDAFWGARYAIVADPDGNHVGLMSPSDPNRQGPPPAI